MNYKPATLPELIVNRAFMVEFVSAVAPCFAMGLVEEDGIKYLDLSQDRMVLNPAS